tara:strand:- start:318 stop:539 length:222 start_codon:yes stop_codon:yes gene_type:complete
MGKEETIGELDKQIKNLKTEYIIHIILIVIGIGLCFTIILAIFGIIIFLFGAVGLSKATKKVAALNLKKAELE